MQLSGRTAFVTGGNLGIGLAVVRALAGAGAEVAFTARSRAAADAAMAELGGLPGVTAHVCDVTDRAGMAGLLARAPDILVNNAGIIGPIGRITDVAVEDWAKNIAVNLTGAFHATQLALRGMVARGAAGTIVNLSSGAARRPLEGWSAYCAGKAALAMLTRSIHEEYGRLGIRVFGFAPGVVDTGMQAEIRASGINPVSRIPQGDLAGTGDPARGIVWLCTGAADGLAGQEVDVRDEGFRRMAGLG